MNRYFVVFYNVNTGSASGFGGFNLVTDEGFPSNIKMRSIAAYHSGYPISTIVITGWKELNEQDYLAYTATPEEEEA